MVARTGRPGHRLHVCATYLFVSGILWTPLFGTPYEVDGYLSPLFSPLIAPAWLPTWISPGLLILWIPLGFRATCYYYRKAYYRFYFADPPGCAVGEPTIHQRYRMETAFPFILQNLHRYFLYLAFIPLFFLWVDAVASFVPSSGGSRIGLGSVRPVVNAALLTRLLAVVPLAAPPRRRQARLLLVHAAAPGRATRCGSGSRRSTGTTWRGPGRACSRSRWPTSTSGCSRSGSSPTRRSTSERGTDGRSAPKPHIRPRRPRHRRRRRRPAGGDRGGGGRRDVGLVCKSLLGKAHTVMAEGGVAAALGHVAAARLVADPLPRHDGRRQAPQQPADGPAPRAWRRRTASASSSCWGAVFDRTARRADPPAAVRRPLPSAPRPRRRPDRARDDPDAPGPGGRARASTVYMECTITHLMTGPRRGRPARSATGATTGAADRLPGQGDRPRDRRHRQGVRGHLELVGVQRRRPGAGLRGRRRAHRHGVRPVPPDRDGLAARRPRPARDRGGPRRGRDPAQQGRRAVHVEVPARGPPRRVRRDRRGGRPAGSRPCRAGRETDARRPPELSTRDNVARAIYTEVREGRGSPHGGVFLDISYLPADHVRRKLPSMYEQFKELADVDITTGPMEVGPTTHYVMGGIRVDAETGATTVRRAVRRGRGRRRDARREPARRQLAVGPARVRGAGRAPPRRRTRRPRRASPYLDPVQVQDGGRGARRAARARPSGEDPYAHPARPPGDDAAPGRDLPRSRPTSTRRSTSSARSAAALAERPRRRAAAPTTRAGTSSSSCGNLLDRRPRPSPAAPAQRTESRGAHSRLDYPGDRRQALGPASTASSPRRPTAR